MCNSLGDITGQPTDGMNRQYKWWAEGGAATSIIGEVRSVSGYEERAEIWWGTFMSLE